MYNASFMQISYSPQDKASTTITKGLQVWYNLPELTASSFKNKYTTNN